MNERILEIRIGVLVVATCLTTGILLIAISGMTPFLQSQYTVRIKFDQAPGVQARTPVRKNGVLIGRVSDVDLPDKGGVLVTVRIDADRNIFQNEMCRIGTGTLLGDAQLEFVLDPDAAPTDKRVKDGEYLKGSVANDPISVLIGLEHDAVVALDSVKEAGLSVKDAGDQVATLTRRMNSVFGDDEEQFRRMIGKTETAVDSFTEAMNSINQLTGDEETKRALQDAIASVPGLMTDAHDTLEDLQRMAQKAEVNLDNLQGFTGPLRDRGEQLVDSIDATLSNLDETTAQLAVLVREVNEGDGSLHRLIHDPDLYQRLNQAAGNIERASRQLEPVLYNAKVFTDKIARNPRQLGVQGALDRQRSGTKYPINHPDLQFGPGKRQEGRVLNPSW